MIDSKKKQQRKDMWAAYINEAHAAKVNMTRVINQCSIQLVMPSAAVLKNKQQGVK